MLINTPRYVEVLAELANSSFEFHLTGSRFFGYYNPESDWDFFVEAQALYGGSGLLDFLQDAGFYLESSPVDYRGMTGITQIWKHGYAPVHIQVVEDAKAKVNVQCTLNSDSRLVTQMGKLSKEGRKALWNAALASFSAGEERGIRLTRFLTWPW